MLTLTPVVCMLSAIALSNICEHCLEDDMKGENPSVEESDEENKRNQGNSCDKAGKVRKHGIEQEIVDRD